MRIAHYQARVHRYVIRRTQSIYGYWFFHMWEKVVGPLLASYHPIFHPKTSQDVDNLISAEITM
jgi:hypothetical protein